MADEVGKVFDSDRRTLGEHQSALDHVFELPHVAVPGVGEQQLHSRRLEPGHVHAELFGELVDEIASQGRDILAPLTQRRQMDAHNVDPIVEVGSEVVLSDLLLEVARRGRDDPHVDLARRAVTDAADLALLEGAQQLHLKLGWQLTDLVQEQRTVVGLLEQPGPVDVGAGESAFDVSEKLGLQQVLRDGATVDRHEGPRGSRARPVDQARDELLARPALARDQHRRGVLGHLGSELDGLPHPGALGDDLGEALVGFDALAQARDLAPQLLAFLRLPECEDHLCGGERLGQVVVGALLHRLDR